MKYNTFVKLRGLGCAALVIAPIALLVVRSASNKREPNVPTPAEIGLTSEQPPSNSAAPSSPDSLSDVDREVLRMQKESASNGTPDGKGLKWRVKKGGVVIELRCDLDKGYTTWNRAKVDANSNKQYDETWAFKKDGTIERRVAPNDDQNYTQTFVLEGEKWVAK